MKLLISGATGTIGTALVNELRAAGHDITCLVRRPGSAGGLREVHWNSSQALDPAQVDGFDTVIHLAGESIARRWTPEAKRILIQSRVEGTKNLSQALALCQKKPQVLVSASAIGHYGNRGDEVLTESSPGGTGFLSDVVAQWEAATLPAQEAGIRVIHARFGVVLSARGGALTSMLPAFRMGAGGRLGDGRQWMSWVAVDDVVRAIEFALNHESIRGPINVVSPNPATNEEFTRALAGVLHRPAIFPLPAFAVRLIFGEMGETLLLGSQRVLPKSLLDAGFQFRYPELKAALESVLERK